jgi:GNAT superfamily N-acetyltransferase
MNIQLFSKLNGPIAAKVKEIYETSFPETERQPFSFITDCIEQGSQLIYIAMENDIAVGFALIVVFSDSRVWHLNYFAVDEPNRGQGIGTAILQHIRKYMQSAKTIHGLLFEVEAPAEAKTENESVERARRIEFYKRNGAFIIEDGGAYRMPDYTKKNPKGLKMRLMWLPAVPEPRDLITLIYTEIYENDPLLQPILSEVPENIQRILLS